MTDQPNENPPPSAGQVPGAYPPPGQYPPGQYPPGQYGYQPAHQPPKHPQATTVLVLGILGLVLCQVVSPFAWSMGNKAQKEMLANPGAHSGDGEINAGRILGIIGTAILGLAILFFVALFVIGVGIFATAVSV